MAVPLTVRSAARRAAALAAIAAFAACAPPPPQAPAPIVQAPDTTAPPAIAWVRASAEHDAAFLQAYRTAETRLRELSADVDPGTWAVVLDADETVLDNSSYEAGLARTGASFDTASWNGWVRDAAAPALPGAADFIRFARELGGRVVIVTNRDEALCPPTEENFRKLEIVVDRVLCKPSSTSDKNPRFQSVEKGTAGGGLPALNVLMFVGDNIQDFPALTQAARANVERLEPFGRAWIVLPNPMYGSWQRH